MYCCVPGSDCFKWIKTIAPVIVTMIFGAIAIYFTRRQNKVAEAKLKLDLFERRYAIFKKVWEITSATGRHGSRASQKMMNFATPFNNFRPEAAFLFGSGMQDYIDELSHNWDQLYAQEGMRDDDKLKSDELITQLKNYFLEQASGGVKDRFSPFLDFANWK